MLYRVSRPSFFFCSASALLLSIIEKVRLSRKLISPPLAHPPSFFSIYPRANRLWQRENERGTTTARDAGSEERVTIEKSRKFRANLIYRRSYLRFATRLVPPSDLASSLPKKIRRGQEWGLGLARNERPTLLTEFIIDSTVSPSASPTECDW